MRLFLFAALAALAVGPAGAQTLELIGTVEVPTIPRPGADDPDQPEREVGIPDVVGGSDVWPYIANDGSEYVIMGDVEGLTVVAVPSLEVVAHVPGPTRDAPFFWRDIKTYGSFAYVTAEAFGENEGLMVLDLRRLPERVEVANVVRGENDRLVSSHNLSIDTVTGHAWVLNSNGTQIVGLDLSNPVAPVEVGHVDVPDSHDIYARGDTLYIAEGRSPVFSVWDVSDKANPSLMGRVNVPNPGYVHNVWPTDDGMHVMTTEETVDKSVKVWDLSDLDNPTLVGEWLGESRIAHNVHIQGDYAFISHYASGVYVLDISDRENPVVVAQHDTHPENDDAAFYGNWGTTLPSPGGYIYASDLEGTLTVLKWDPNRLDG